MFFSTSTLPRQWIVERLWILSLSLYPLQCLLLILLTNVDEQGTDIWTAVTTQMLSTAHFFPKRSAEVSATLPFPLFYLSFPPPQVMVVFFLFLFHTTFSTAPIQLFLVAGFILLQLSEPAEDVAFGAGSPLASPPHLQWENKNILEGRCKNIMAFNKCGCSNLFLFPLFSGFGHWDKKWKLQKLWVTPLKSFSPFPHPPYF